MSASPQLFLPPRTANALRTRPDEEEPEPSATARGAPRVGEGSAADGVMIINLERDNLSRVFVPGTVRWPELIDPGAARRHRTSRLDGSRTRCGMTSASRRSSRRFSLSGSVHGAPKIAALAPIASLEPVRHRPRSVLWAASTETRLLDSRSRSTRSPSMEAASVCRSAAGRLGLRPAPRRSPSRS